MTSKDHAGPIPAKAGVGLRLEHLHLLATEDDDAPPRVPWLEIHSETFLAPGGPRAAMLAEVARRYPISCHGVGLSLGSAQGVDAAHLGRLKSLFERVKPSLISEHLAWSVVDGAYLNDLLPLPYTPATLDVVADNVARTQDAFGARVLVENPSTYLTFSASSMHEWEFLARLVDRTGCGLLLDVNNIYVSGRNNAFDPAAYIAAAPMHAVGEIHLAGHSREDDLLIDTHSTHVCDEVWALYRSAVARTGPVPTLIEWDMDIPAFDVLEHEAGLAQAVMNDVAGRGHAA